ncbi:peptide ABC transporter substrate-binding protein [Wenxinia marina]|uniref:ABC-type oligopeptide transport system, periplasmic component n=1 Tax=Wenxinia marina DSM 24838 TaxID=1123501 RepID=A0A0D0Q2S6_9RHOB|nr:peptide ABC transporter substrate-binding protein [Wenxinia marina]KIQ68849.1 ABC-type oligopeptide transport system, periplasmic component [Wenxinia marina DSM 24838]GGL64741.1 peptide ABC transporter substrate-binding protein [Wenxinia marina]
MTLRRTLLSGTAAALVAMAGSAAFAQDMAGPNGEQLAENQTFTYRVLDEFPSIDPNLIEDVEGSAIGRNLFEGLMNQDSEGNVVPGVATGYEVSDDGLTYTFNLRPEAMWSNGEPVTAQDFVYSWQRAADPATASEYQWYMGLMAIENVDAVMAGEMDPSELGVTAVDDHTLEVRLTQALPYFPQMVTHTTTFPVPQSVIEEHGDAWTQPGNMVGNGAYVLEERVPQERIVLTKNENYWDAENVYLDTVTALIINDENQALTRYLAGELDQTDMPAGQFPRLSEEYPTEAISVPNLCTYYYNVNLTDAGLPALQEASVREALSLAIDRDVIVDSVLAGGQVPAFSLTHWATAGFEVPESDVMSMTQEERNARAQELMAEAGYGTDGEPLEIEILYNTSDAHRSVAVAIGQMWQQTLGVTTTLANQEWQTFLTTRGEKQYPGVARAGWCADYNEASSFLDIMQSDSGYNDSGFASEEYDSLMAEARTAEDPLPLYQQAEEIIMAEHPILPIYFYSTVFMLDDTIKGWPLENAQDNWYAKDLYRVAGE